MKNQLNKVFESLNIKANCVNYDEHRHMAFYDVELFPGATIRKIENRTKEIALGLKSKTVPTVKFLPSRGLLQLQVAFRDADILPVENLYADILPEDQLLPFVLGETVEGERLYVDLAEHPHTLVAGGTGSGKSVFLHTLIANAVHLTESQQRNVQIFLCDPKRVEFTKYANSRFNKIVSQLVYDYESALAMLEFLRMEMEARYKTMAKLGVTNIKECPVYSPYIVIIDEVADLMLMDKKLKRFENLLVTLAQKSRAAGIHFVLATQRPSVDVLTGLIKANFPARVSCKVASRIDSKVILDANGAEHLLGQGDAILHSPANEYTRFQVAYTNPDNIAKNYLAL